MNDIALASIILVSMAATTAAVIGIAYLCTHKDKPSENNSEPGFSDSQQLNSKLNGEQNSKNKDKKASNLRSSFFPTPTQLKPRNSNSKSNNTPSLNTNFSQISRKPKSKNSNSTSNSTPNLNKNSSQIPRELKPKIQVTDTYTINGRKIKLYKQSGLTCGIYAAAFAICANGKDNASDIEDIVKNVIEVFRINPWQTREMSDIMNILTSSGVSWSTEVCDGGREQMTVERVSTTLRKCIDEKNIVILNLAGHWVTVCGYEGDEFSVYDSSPGCVVKMSAKSIYNRLPVARKSEIFGKEKLNKKELTDYSTKWNGKQWNALKVKC